MARCIVLASYARYSKEKTGWLRDMLLKERPELVAIGGVDCEAWEEAIDYLCVDLDQSGKMPGAFCNTTSHPQEPIETLVGFAEQWCDLKDCNRDIRVIEI